MAYTLKDYENDKTIIKKELSNLTKLLSEATTRIALFTDACDNMDFRVIENEFVQFKRINTKIARFYTKKIKRVNQLNERIKNKQKNIKK